MQENLELFFSISINALSAFSSLNQKQTYLQAILILNHTVSHPMNVKVLPKALTRRHILKHTGTLKSIS
jgi:hypothetical protein